jgi:ABC-type lipoprotein export system ATPase subunit
MNTQEASYPGSRWWKFDFHTHTPASLDTPWHRHADTPDALTPEAWLLKYMAAGIDCVAVTDHNSGVWIDILKSAYASMKQDQPEGFRELHLFPGVELWVNGGFHLLALFDKTAATSDIDTLLVKVDYAGTKGGSDGVTRKSPVEVVDAIFTAGGIPIPAHVDQPKGLLRAKANEPGKCDLDANTVRQLLEHPQLMAMEVVEAGFTPPAIYQESRTHWAGVVGTDCHNFRSPYPQLPGSRFTWVKMGTPSLEALKLALHDGNEFSLKRSDAVPSGSDPNDTPEDWIESLEISDARLMGRRAPAKFEFSPWMNAVIGGRGSGKSTLIHFIRLVTRREESLGNLGANNRVLRNLASFKKVGEKRSDEGGLLAETKAVVVYRKAGERFRLTWLRSDGGTTVESFDAATGEWLPASSQDVVSRFPLGIFSQDEIGLIAENPSALLHRVDEATGKVEWDTQWENELNTFLALLGKIRSQRSRLAEKERLKGELEDVLKKLAVLENSEHAELFKAARKARRQRDQIGSLFEAYDRVVGEISGQQVNLLLHDLPEDLIDPERMEDDILAETDLKLRSAVERAARIMGKLRTLMLAISAHQKQVLATSEWESTRLATESSYAVLMKELEEKGLGDPAKFSQVAARRQILEKSLKEIEAVETEIKQLRDDATASQQRLLDLRAELQMQRRAFLTRELKNNPYVKIELNAFGSEEDKDQVEAALRKELGCESSHSGTFQDPERQTGFIDTLYTAPTDSEPQRVEALLARIKNWKKQVEDSGFGRPSELSKVFANFLKRELERRPEYFDRFHAWWPEDSLAVSYSKGGKGQNFVSLKNGSAGEKAAALLAFFLAQGNGPLVIDQPENDLDNHLITDLVVKQLRENKQRRQVIAVTHNPNIVVNGDAEMVHAMRFESGQCSAQASGPLQENAVRTEVCEVMEGGKPALTARYQRLI